MSSLFWPGDERAAGVFDDRALVDAMVRVEEAWLVALVGAGIAPPGALVRLTAPDPATLDAEAGGNPVIPLVATLRSGLSGEAATWLHRGLTSQDVLDTALVLCLRDAVDRVLADLAGQATALARLSREHRGSVMAGRTLTQHAVPITFGLVAAGWLASVSSAGEALRACREQLRAQTGGAAGTLAALVEAARVRGLADPVGAAAECVRFFAGELALQGGAPWHTAREVVTRTADALVGCADVWGRIAADVALLGRPEIAELAEPQEDGRGGSSTMPHKANPVLSVLVARHAVAAPSLAATLHGAAAAYTDQRPAGPWHAEWDTLRTLARRSVVAASHTAELLEGLRVDADRMRAIAEAAHADLLAERDSIATLLGGDPGGGLAAYLGATDLIIDDALERAARTWHWEDPA